MNEFCRASYHRVGKHPLDRSEHHHLDCYEFIHIHSDNGTVLIRDKLYPLKRGGLYLIDGSSPHCTDPVDNDSYERSVLIVGKEFACTLFKVAGLGDSMDKLFSSGGGYFCIDAATGEAVDREFHTCAEAVATKSRHMQAIVASALTRIALAALTGTSGELVGRSTLARAISYISAHLSEPLTIESIAEGVSVSKYHLCHSFREKTGMTVMNYIIDRRLALAKEKLVSSDAPITELSTECGFGTPSNFARVFQRIEGISPRDYRKTRRRDIPQ